MVPLLNGPVNVPRPAADNAPNKHKKRPGHPHNTAAATVATMPVVLLFITTSSKILLFAEVYQSKRDAGKYPASRLHGFLTIRERTAKGAKNAKKKKNLSELCVLRVKKMTQHRFTMDFEKAMIPFV